MPTLFVSDLHLDARQPAVIDRFLRLLAGPAQRTDTLFILGDLFELWIGDDDIDPGLVPVLDALRALGDCGTQVNILRGNRDFLLGEAFAERTGCRLREEPCVFEQDGTTALLCHGDALCTDDVDYQQFRALVRNPAWQLEFLCKPVEERRRLAQTARNLSRETTGNKPEAITDVNPQAVAQLMREYGCRVLIHGHTHRPGLHRVELDGLPAHRIVLGDWPQRASVLFADRGRLLLESPEALGENPAFRSQDG